ncbi:MAG: precorrin-3B C(17)-methyltransferase [Albidovulum sp.]|nr:precorrin-3B C(17)-methyltransferase [Albidovulum sp.]
MQPLDPAVFCLAESGLGTATRIARKTGGQLLVRSGMAKADGASVMRDVPAELRSLFLSGRPIIGVCAAGILIRALAPVVLEKKKEPPVVSVSENGNCVVPLLGGHRGGNRLARDLADLLGAVAAITTASDLAFGIALDDPPEGWRLENPENCKRAAAALLAGKPARVSGGAEWLAPLRNRPRTEFLESGEPGSPVVLLAEGAEPLVYRRTDYFLGAGCSRGCEPDQLIGLARRAMADAGISPFEIAAVCTIDLKEDELAIHALAENLDVPTRFYAASRLESETPRLPSPSETVFAAVGCHGVCEAAALAAAGTDGRLEVAKLKTSDATCAIARRGSDSGDPGRGRGRLAIVGIGPGKADWRTPEASRLIAESDELVGYGAYLDLLGPLAAGKTLKPFPIGHETERCGYALGKAADGSKVALVCSGDPGIYAMASLVMEMLDSADSSGCPATANRAEIVVAPGISAMQAAAAKGGSLLGHDFCAISLSDLMTPRDVIRSRVEAAAKGDFVVAFYNPQSQRRRDLLGEAVATLRRWRPPDTPVLIARNLGRDGEFLEAGTLDALERSGIDMSTIVLVGNSASRARFGSGAGNGVDGRHLYTPRGYGRSKPDGKRP